MVLTHGLVLIHQRHTVLGDNKPAYWVSWDNINDVGGFLDKLNEASGCDISLPQIVLVIIRTMLNQAVIDFQPKLSGSMLLALAPTRFNYGEDLNYSQLGNYAVDSRECE